MATLADVRAKHPEYSDMTDQQLADGLYKKFYSDMPRAEFDQKVGLQPTAPAPQQPVAPQDPAQSPNLLDSTLATVNGLTGSVPFLQQASDGLVAIGQTAGDMLANRPGSVSSHFAENQASRQRVAEKAPIAQTLGDLAGTIGTTALLPQNAARLPGKLVQGALGMAGYEGARSLSKGNTGGTVLADMGLGAAGGALAPIAGAAVEKAGAGVAKGLTNIVQNKLTKAATASAPSARELAQASRDMFQAADNAGVSVNADKFVKLVGGLAQSAQKDHINETLDPKAFATFGHLVTIAKSALDGTRPLTLSDLHTIRQIAQRAAVSTEGRDAMFANRIVDGIDQFMTKGDGLIGGTAKDLMSGISTWARSKKVGLLETAMQKAENYPSGLESGLRAQFKSLLNNKATANLFTPVERQAMQDVVGGAAPVKALRLLGMFKGFGGAGLGAMLGTAFGPLGTGIGTAVGGAAGVAGKKITEKATEAAATRAAKIVATPNIPAAKQLPNLLAPAAMPLNILIRGGAPAALAQIVQR